MPYGAEFETTAGEWTEVLVPLVLLTPTVRGETLQGPPIEPAQVGGVGVLIANKREGAFALTVD